MNQTAKTDRIHRIVARQREYFRSGATRPVSARIKALKRLRQEIRNREGILLDALKADLHKCRFEGYMCEVGMCLDELGYLIKNVSDWAKPQKRPTPIAQFKSKSYELPEPYGVTLVMAPWNYPILLSLDPVFGAVAAGNCVILKPSAYAPHTSRAMANLIAAVFDPGWVTVVEGGREENNALLEERFDYIFFTGSVDVGKLVMEKASRHLTPVTLELGGKSPVIVDKTANIPLTAKRLAFGKILNAGQTCVAPDYCLVDRQVKDQLVAELKKQFIRMLGMEPTENENLVRIINRKHFDRLCALLDGERQKIVCGGDTDEKRLMISPTVIDHVTWDDPVMQQEIFGPLLPVLTYSSPAEIPALLADQPKPLAFYVFSEDKSRIRRLISSCSFGGGCVNDTVIHLATSSMGFGGVGESGLGAYHGKTGFEAFSHQKSIVDKKTWIDMPMRYQPFTQIHDKMIRMFLH